MEEEGERASARQPPSKWTGRSLAKKKGEAVGETVLDTKNTPSQLQKEFSYLENLFRIGCDVGLLY